MPSASIIDFFLLAAMVLCGAVIIFGTALSAGLLKLPAPRTQKT